MGSLAAVSSNVLADCNLLPNHATLQAKLMLMRRMVVRNLVLILCMTSLLIAFTTSHAGEPAVRYIPNMLETTPFGPAAADIVVVPSNFLPCLGGPIALCYYSGPEPANPLKPDLSCELTDDGKFANCRCVEISYGPYYVDINAILDKGVYLETVKKCGKSGADCQGEPNKAPVCDAIRTNQLLSDAIPPPDTISTFSYALSSIPEFKIGQTSCESAKYAGCMTAPCLSTNDTIEICDVWGESEVCSQVPVNECTCPTVTGPYQVGQSDAECDISGSPLPENVWSAAYNPALGKISQFSCVPDAPGENGCTLLPPIPKSDPLEPYLPGKPKNISCGKVCAEYRNNKQDGIQVGFTCDATLCTTSSIKDVDLVVDACSGLEDGKISETLRLEVEVGCSCCASQICGCEPSPKTNAKILQLNEAQRLREHAPQCDINGSLCGGL